MVIGGSSGDFGRLLADETEKWTKVTKVVAARTKPFRCHS
jgi:hypothetical protein